MLLLNDDRLDSLRCSWCHKYLSVFPVRNHPNRDVTCGRCSKDDDDDGGVRSILYELVARKYLFRCVNRYEGCGEVLHADETEAHERRCAGKTFRCPKCRDDVDRTVPSLMWHFEHDHPSSRLRKNRFDARPFGEDVMLYVQDDVVFFITIQCKWRVLYLIAMTLTEVHFTQAFLISRRSLWEKSSTKPFMTVDSFSGDYYVCDIDPLESIEVLFCLEVSKNDILYQVSDMGRGASAKPERVGSTVSRLKRMKFDVRPAAELEDTLGYKLNNLGTALSNRIGHKIDLTCSNCKQLIGLPVYRCSKFKHQICNVCRVWCGICDVSVVQSDADDLLHKIGSHLKFRCRWGCGEYFACDLIREHEKSCKPNVLKCPMCSFEVYLSSSTFMDIHLLDDHQILNFCGDYQVERIRNVIAKRSVGELCFLVHDKCCYLKWSKKKKKVNYSNCEYYVWDFGLLRTEPNIQLAMICNGSKYLNVVPKINFQQNHSYLPYINFNYKE